MIVLHEPKIIVLKARKVGGTSFEIALSRYATESSVITPIAPADERIRERLGFRGPQNYEWLKHEQKTTKPKEGKKFGDDRDYLKFYNHISAEDVKERLGADVWESYTKVAIIRNPYDYLVSVYFYLLSMQGKTEFDVSFRDWFSYNKDKICLNDDIYKINNDAVVDVLLNYSSIDIEMKGFESQFAQLDGLAELFSSIAAKSMIRPKHATIDFMYSNAPEAARDVYSAHSDVIKKFGFSMPNI